MRWHLNLLLAVGLLPLIGCEPDSRAFFEVSPAKAYLGQEVVLTNLSQNADSFLWDFGDQFYSQEVSPVHIYGAAGDYYIHLTAKGKTPSYIGYQLEVYPDSSSFSIYNKTTYDLFVRYKYPQGGVVSLGKLVKNVESKVQFTHQDSLAVLISATEHSTPWYTLVKRVETKKHKHVQYDILSDSFTEEDLQQR